MIKCYDKVVYKRVDELIPYEQNARVNDRAVSALVKAIPVMGFNVPGFKSGAGLFFMSARTLYQNLGISFSSR